MANNYSTKFPQATDDSQAFLDAADERMGQLRDLGAESAGRYLNIGPKRSLNKQQKDLQNMLSQKHLEYYGKGMQKQRLEKGLTRMKGGKEVKQ